MRKLLLLAAFSMCFSLSAFGWNCPSGMIRQQAPPGTPTSTPYYDVVEGIAFICVPTPVPPTTPPTTTPSSTSSSSTASSASNSNSSANATGGNGTATATGGTGGNSTSTSGVKNSGNSSNTNTSTATGGSQKQGQGQTQSNTSANQSSSTGGNNSNDSTTVTNIKPAAASAYAPTSLPSAPCTKSFGAGANTVPGGFSFGGNKIDAGCDARELARSYSLTGSRIAACKVLIATKRSKQAGVTLEDCMATPEPVAVAAVAPVVVAPVAPAPAPQVIVVQVPAPVVQTAPVVTEPAIVKVAPKAQSHKPVYTHGQPCKVPNSLYQPSPKQ